MRPPPVDVYRAPFVEPLGHLVLNAAQAELALIEVCAAAQGANSEVPARRAHAEAARRLRNIDTSALRYVNATIAKIKDEFWREYAVEVFGRLLIARQDRNRAIHDAVEVGAFVDAEAGYEVLPLRVKYELSGERLVTEVEPGDVLLLAHQFHVIWQDLEVLGSVLALGEEG